MPGISSLTHMSFYLFSVAFFGALSFASVDAHAVDLSSHKAIYDIRMKSTQTGSQILDVRGKMLFVLKKSCDGWISDHTFVLDYEYTGSPPVQVESKFTSFERFDGKSLNFSSSRTTDGAIDQQLRGLAKIAQGQRNKVIYSLPENLSFHLSEQTLFPAAHTLKLIDAAQKGQKIVNETVFDGSDDKGPVEINVVIGKKTMPDLNTKFDKDLAGVPGWSMRMAVFPTAEDDNQTISDYEMTMNLLENGVIKGMTVDYHSFSVVQKLVAIEAIKDDKCGVE